MQKSPDERRRNSWRYSWINNPIGHHIQQTYYQQSTLLPLTMSSVEPNNPQLLQHQQQQQVSGVGGTNNSSNVSTARNKRRGSMLGASRKIVNATVRRPLKRVGRFVGRGRSNGDGRQRHGYDVDDEEMVGVDDGYGPMPEDESEHSTELLPRQLHPDEVSNRDLGLPGRQQLSARRLSAASTGTRDGVFHHHHHHHRHYTNDPDWPVNTMERLLRQLLLILAAYILGAKRPEWLLLVSRATEYAVTAWGTCVVITLLAYLQHHYPHLMHPSRPSNADATAADSQEPLITGVTNDETMPLLQGHRQSEQEQQPLTISTDQISAETSNECDVESAPIGRTISVDDDDTVERSEEQNNHTALDPYYVMNVYTGERIFPNSAEPCRIETEWFDMTMLVLIRTPDVDDPSAPTGNAANTKVSDYLRGRQRRFEFQYQIKLKKVPTGKAVYFACELDEPIKMGLIQRAFVGAAMAFMKTTNPTFHYSIMGSKKSADLKYEKPHMSFTVEGSLDRLVVTKPGETPPQLGTAIHEDPESMKRRKKGIPIDWNTEDTYTMALWSAYVDFLDWRVINLPGIRPFTLSSVLGTQCINLTMYLIDENRCNDKHQLADITNVINLELSNNQMAVLGPSAQRWVSRNPQDQKSSQQGPTTATIETNSMNVNIGSSNERQPSNADPNEDRPVSAITAVSNGKNTASPITTPGPVSQPAKHGDDIIKNGDDGATSVIEAGVNTDSNKETNLHDFSSQPELSKLNEFHAEEMEDVDQEAATAAELGEGIYLRSGDSVVLRELILDGEESNNNSTVANGGGFVVLQDQDATVSIFKARGAKRSKLIKTGDTVMFKMVQKKGNEIETRYLSIHRGWWLKWVSSVPTKNGFFTIYTHDSEFNQQDEKGVRTGETQSSYLTLGGSFMLRHKRWKSYYVGVAAEPSPTYGGRMLGLYIPDKQKGGGGQAADEQYHSDDEGVLELEVDPDITDDNNKTTPWMKPLLLCAHDASSLLTTNAASPKSASLDQYGKLEGTDVDALGTSSTAPSELTFSNQHSQIDVPAWIEMMSRTERTRQLTYVVRVIHPGASPAQDNAKQDDAELHEPGSDNFVVRLRSGRELAQIMSVGQPWRNLSNETQGSSNSNSNGTHLALNSSSNSLHYSNAADNHHHLRRVKRNDGSSPTTSSKHLRNNVPSEGSTTPSKKDVAPRVSVSSDSVITSPIKDASVSLEMTLDDFVGKEDPVEASEDESDAESVDIGDEQSMERDDWLEGSALFQDEREPEHEHSEKTRSGRKGRTIIGKVAKTAKTATVATGKTAVKTVVGTGKLTGKVAVGTGKLTGKVAKGTGKMAVRSSKKVAKGTVIAGKSVIAPISRKSKKPPTQEPKTKQKTKERKRQERDVHLQVNKSLKRIERIESKTAHDPTMVAGELCAPEQSCRTASRVLSRMSNLPPTSPAWTKCNAILSSQLSLETEQDRWFLQGDNVQIGVTPLTSDKSRGRLIHESLVARCLWESHWREEWCGMYESCVSFYAPLSKSPCLEIAFIDIQNVRPLDAGGLSPLPGFPLLVLETAWRCHYLAFSDEEARDTFGDCVDNAITSHVEQVEERLRESEERLRDSDLQKARFWQGFQSLSEPSLSSGRGKWAKISSSQKTKHRTILNCRRMVFDLQSTRWEGDMSNGYTFVEDLFRTALSFSLDNLEKDPDSFVEFLDATSQLRLLRLEEVDTSSKRAFCLFVNLYHCLLQHALLLSIDGPLHKRSVGHFMRTQCYEIGGDVFSLAELHSCIIRGKMTRPVNPKPPYIEAPKKSNPYRFYALDHFTDCRVNFVVNTGDIACPSKVFVLRASEVERQLNEAAAMFLNKEVRVDPSKRVVILPKVCEIYKNDFESDALTFCLGGLDEVTASTIREMMRDESVSIRYQHTVEHYHSSLGLHEFSTTVEREEPLGLDRTVEV